MTDRFSSWRRWTDRKDLPRLDLPGVYVLAHRHTDTGFAVILTTWVVYIGETCARSLGKRLDEFARSARTGRRGHSGGRAYHERFGAPQPELHVKVLAVTIADPVLRSVWIRYRERQLIWEHFLECKEFPVCNLK